MVASLLRMIVEGLVMPSRVSMGHLEVDLMRQSLELLLRKVKIRILLDWDS